MGAGCGREARPDGDAGGSRKDGGKRFEGKKTLGSLAMALEGLMNLDSAVQTNVEEPLRIP